MKNRTTLLSVIVLLAFLLAACGAKAPQTTPPAMAQPTEAMMTTEPAMMGTATEAMMATEPAMMGTATEAAMMNETPAPGAMAGNTPTGGAMLEAPAWFGTSLKDVRSGDSFTIDDFKGKVVLVETMAVWCTTCYQQQTQIKALNEALGMRADFVSVSLDIDPNEDESALAAYTQKNSGFDWRYAVAGTDVAREIGKVYGDQFLNPPSAPVLVIDRHGVAHPLPFGVKNADDLMKAVQPYLDAKM